MRKFLLIIILIFIAVSTYAQEQIYTVNFCNLTIIRNPNDNSLVFQDATGNETVSYHVTSLPRFNPSPDCRYLAANMRLGYGELPILHVWDAQAGQEISTHRYSLFEWSPDSNRLYIKNRTGTYLWDFVNDSLMTLSTENINRYYPRAIWSAERGILYFSQTAHNRGALPNDETVSASIG